MRRWLWASAVGIGLSILLVGCSGERTEPEGASRSATSASSASSAPAATSTPATSAALSVPVMPEEARRSDLAGERAFIIYWFELYDYAYASGDTAPLLAVTKADLPDMKLALSQISEIHSRGGQVSGWKYQLVDSVTVPLRDSTTIAPTIMIRRGAGSITYADGTTDKIEETPVRTYGMVLNWIDDHWYMYGIGKI